MISDLLPPVDLTELLLEINAHTGFADEFFHASEASARVDDLPVSISAVLMAEACNIGLEPLIRSNVPALTRHRLNWTKANYLRAETITSANARLVDFQATLPLAQIWGGGEVASADGMRFVRHCCKVSDEAAFCLIQRPYISKTLLTRRISPRGSP